MPRIRIWLRDHVLNFLRDPDRKSHSTTTNNKHNISLRKSIIVSAPIPLGSLAIDLASSSPPLPTSLSAQDISDTYPLRRQSRYMSMSSDQLPLPQTFSMILEDPDEDLLLPPTHLPEPTKSSFCFSDPSESSPLDLDSPTTRQKLPTRNFSRRFSRRLSSFSAHSVSSYASSSEAKRMSQMSGVSGVSSSGSSRMGEDDWGLGNRGSRRWSRRLSGALETHGRDFRPLGVV